MKLKKMISPWTEIKECLACDQDNLVKYLDLGNQPLANSYISKEKDLPKFPLVVNFCQNCSHSQLSIAVNPSLMFFDYKYVSGTTQTLKEHFKDLSSYACDMFPKELSNKLNVLDIGANDGSLLERFQELGCLTFGVDPAANLKKISSSKGIEVLVDFWSSSTSWKMPNLYDIITACNVFAHNLNPTDFLKGCQRVLKEQGLIIIEFPYGKNTFKENQFQQIYHEHINYFNCRSFVALVEKCGFRVCDINLKPIHGGSVRFTLRRGSGPHCLKLSTKVLEEKGLDLLNTYKSFAKQVQQNISELKSLIIKLGESQRTIVAYGASAKSTVLFNHPDFLQAVPYIDFVVDDNPMKQKLFCPGSNLPIKSIESLIEVDNPVILSTAWNFNEEIKKRLRTRNIKANIVNVVPIVSVESV